MVISKGKVLVIKGERAIVELDNSGKKITVGIKPSVEVKKGDIVMVAFGQVVDKI